MTSSENTRSVSKQNDQQRPQPKSRPRMHTLDELRGFAIFCMIFYHTFYTIGFFFGMSWGIWLINFFSPAEPFFAGLFILIAGLSCNLSHSNLERGVKLAIISVIVTIITYFVLGEKNMIRFGILHMLSASMILYGLINKYLKLIPPWIGILFNAVIFALTFSVPIHIFGVPPLFSVSIPDSFYSTHFLFMLGFPHNTFESSDYFPIIPWTFLFIAGTYIGRIGILHKFPKFMFKKRIPFFALLGRHSLLIYLAHQPVIFALCYAVKGAIFMFQCICAAAPVLFR